MYKCINQVCMLEAELLAAFVHESCADNTSVVAAKLYLSTTHSFDNCGSCGNLNLPMPLCQPWTAACGASLLRCPSAPRLRGSSPFSTSHRLWSTDMCLQVWSKRRRCVACPLCCCPLVLLPPCVAVSLCCCPWCCCPLCCCPTCCCPPCCCRRVAAPASILPHFYFTFTSL